MAITASLVKELRERSGAGMMDCKNALVETGGDVEAALEHLRKSGAAKAAKKAGRIAAEGAIVARVAGATAVLVEINSETDFVAKDDNFVRFADVVADALLEHRPATLDELAAVSAAGETIEQRRTNLVQKIGENVSVRRFEFVESAQGTVETYVHGGRIGVMVAMEGGEPELARDVAMHIAASNPVCIGEDDVPGELVSKEREIQIARAEQEGKPPEIAEKMVMGRIRKFVNEITLTGQPFVKDPDQSVGKLLEAGGAVVTRFVRFEVGEGIEKKQDNFAEEVMAQARGAGG